MNALARKKTVPVPGPALHESGTRPMLGKIRKDLAAKMMQIKGEELAGELRKALPEGYRYLVILESDDAPTSFFTDSEKAEAVRSLREVLAKLEGS